MLVESIILVGLLPSPLGQIIPPPIFAWKKISVDTADGRMCSPSSHCLSKLTSLKSDLVEEDVCMAEISDVSMGEVSDISMGEGSDISMGEVSEVCMAVLYGRGMAT